MLMLSGANPTEHLPLGKVFDARGVRLTAALGDLAELDGVTFVDNFNDRGLRDIRYWSADKLHLNSLGHARVASNVLTALGVAGARRVGRRRGGRRAARAAQPQHRRVLPRVRAAVDRAPAHRAARRATAARRSGRRSSRRIPPSDAPLTRADAPRRASGPAQAVPSTSATNARVRRASPSMRSSSCMLGSTSDGAGGRPSRTVSWHARSLQM